MQFRAIVAAIVICGLSGSTLAADMSPTPYAGQQGRPIKALSDEDVSALRKGEGMGMAKVAELNGYPGPAHVLALAKKLGLTEAQLQQVGPSIDWGIMIRVIRPVRYVAGWGLVDGMDAAFG